MALTTAEIETRLRQLERLIEGQQRQTHPPVQLSGNGVSFDVGSQTGTINVGCSCVGTVTICPWEPYVLGGELAVRPGQIRPLFNTLVLNTVVPTLNGSVSTIGALPPPTTPLPAAGIYWLVAKIDVTVDAVNPNPGEPCDCVIDLAVDLQIFAAAGDGGPPPVPGVMPADTPFLCFIEDDPGTGENESQAPQNGVFYAPILSFEVTSGGQVNIVVPGPCSNLIFCCSEGELTLQTDGVIQEG